MTVYFRKAGACLRACWLAMTSVTLLTAMSAGVSAQTSLTAYYDPATGNFKLQNTTSSPLQVSSFNLLTLGNGAVGSATPNSLGYLNGATVNSSAGSPGSGISFSPIPATFRVSNIQTSGSNGQYSQIAAVLLLVAIIAAIALTLRKRKDSKYLDPGEQVKARKEDRVRIVKMDAVVQAPAAPQKGEGQL